MNKWLAVVAFAGVVSAFDGLAQCTPGPGIIALFKDSNYSGTCRMIPAGSYGSMKAIGMDNDAISSIRIGAGAQAMLCEHTNYGGTCQTFTADKANFGGTPIGHDRTSSFKVGPAGAPFPCTPSAQQIAIFEHKNFGGGCAVRDVGDYTHEDRLGLTNDTVSSVQVGSAVEVLLCRDGNYLGDCELFTAARADMNGTRLGTDRVSSLAVRARGTTSCVPGPNEVSVYRHTAYEGTCVVKPIGEYATAAAMNIAGDEVSSARVGANVQLVACVHSGFGDCTLLSQDTPDFGRTAVDHDRLSSMKVQLRPDCVSRPANDAAVLFENFNFGAPCVVKGPGNYPNESAIGLRNDSILSLRVGSSAQVCACVDANFRGRCQSFRFDTPDLRISGGISSVRVLSQSTECAVPTNGSGVLELAITNCHSSQRTMEVWAMNITDGEPFLQRTSVGVPTSISGGTCSTAFPTRFTLPHGRYLRVAVVDPNGGPNCALPCIRAEIPEVLGDRSGSVQPLRVP